MASNMLSSTTTLILILCAMSSVAIAFVVDTEGEPLRNGGQYYIVPQNIGIGCGLSLTSKDDSLCPLYVTRDKDETSPGIPVRITSPFRIAFITPSLPITIVFETSTICVQTLGWRVAPDSTGRSYIAASGTGEFFAIGQVGEENNVYRIQHAADKSDVGFFNNDALLGINADFPLFVVFKKAYDSVIAMKV